MLTYPRSNDVFKFCWTKPKLQTKLNQRLLKTSPLCSHQGPKCFFFCVYSVSLYQIQDGGGPSSRHPRPLRRGDTLFIHCGRHPHRPSSGSKSAAAFVAALIVCFVPSVETMRTHLSCRLHRPEQQDSHWQQERRPRALISSHCFERLAVCFITSMLGRLKCAASVQTPRTGETIDLK